MKKRVFAIVVLVAVLLTMTVSAVTPRTKTISPGLYFDGKTARCSLTVVADKSSDSISATIQLCKGSSVVKTWTESGTGYIGFSDTYTVSTTGNYTLTASVTINGTTYPTVSKSATCS